MAAPIGNRSVGSHRAARRKGRAARKRHRIGTAAYAAVALTSAVVVGGVVVEPVADGRTLPSTATDRARAASPAEPVWTPAPGAGLPAMLPGAPTPVPLAAPVDHRLGDATGLGGTSGIPATVLDAYRRAETSLGGAKPGCHLTWALLAGIGKIESNHARRGDVDTQGTLVRPIYGPALDGSPGFASIVDRRSGQWARAAGPMQFIPSTWEKWAADGSGDGRANVQNVYDSAESAGRYLCAGGRDLNTGNGLRGAILSYNNSEDYLNKVMAWMRAYSAGSFAVPDAPGNADQDPVRDGSAERAAARPAPAAGGGAAEPVPSRPKPAEPAEPVKPAEPPAPGPVPGPIAGPPVSVPAPLDGVVTTVGQTVGGILRTL